MKTRYLIKNLILLTIIFFLFYCISALGQVPESFNYQAILRDASGNVRENETVSIDILLHEGSPDGSAVFSETHAATTNAFGLINLEIGSVNPAGFAAIDWSIGTYFITLVVDGTEMGTSQLLSVPYALYAKTAENVTGGISETDPVYSASQAANISATDITNLGNLSGTNTGDQNLSSLATKTALGDSTAQVRSEIPMVTSYSVGDFAQGGIVFLVDETGQHGLVCAKEDQSTGVRWYAGTYGNTQAKGDGIYAGEANTSIIIAAQVAIGDDGSTYAARICNELQITESGIIYGDWYLPSKYELNMMYANKATIDATATANGGSAFATYYYWSSTEHGNNFAWDQDFGSGGKGIYSKNGMDRVRAVRAF